MKKEWYGTILCGDLKTNLINMKSYKNRNKGFKRPGKNSLIAYSSTRFYSNIVQSGFYSPATTQLITPKLDSRKYLYLSIDDIYDETKFISNLNGLGLDINSHYIVYIKIRYKGNNYRMVGDQFAHFHTLISGKSLLNIVVDRLEEFFTIYNLNEAEISYVMISFKRRDEVLVSDLKIDSEAKSKLSVSNYNIINTHTINIPLSIDPSIGNTINTVVKNGIITNIPVIFNGESFDLLDKIKYQLKVLKASHKNPTVFVASYKFVLINKINNSYILAYTVKGSEVTKICYSIDGVVLKRVVDTKLDSNTYLRCFGNYQLYFKNNVLLHARQFNPFKAIAKNKFIPKAIEDPNIGVIDTETFETKDRQFKIFALGFYTNLEKKPNVFYIDKETMDSDKLVLEFLTEILKDKYNKHKFYCHNLGGFDVVFILRVILDYNDKVDVPDRYEINCIFRDNKIIKLEISKNISGRKHKVTFVDSYCMLPSSLASLCKSYEIDTVKGIFPYKFSKYNNLFYVGNTPDIEYYTNISDKDYKDIYTSN